MHLLLTYPYYHDYGYDYDYIRKTLLAHRVVVARPAHGAILAPPPRSPLASCELPEDQALVVDGVGASHQVGAPMQSRCHQLRERHAAVPTGPGR